MERQNAFGLKSVPNATATPERKKKLSFSDHSDDTDGGGNDVQTLTLLYHFSHRWWSKFQDICSCW